MSALVELKPDEVKVPSSEWYDLAREVANFRVKLKKYQELDGKIKIHGFQSVDMLLQEYQIAETRRHKLVKCLEVALHYIPEEAKQKPAVIEALGYLLSEQNNGDKWQQSLPNVEDWVVINGNKNK